MRCEANGTKREGVALCLSGGGYRAALFHLGVIRRLLELGVLKDISAISSVSGGSVFSAHLATRMVEKGVENPAAFSDWESDVAVPFRNFVKNDIRTLAFIKNLLWNWVLPGKRVGDLEASYNKYLTKLKIGQLPSVPEFNICATDLTFGACWEFRKTEAGSYLAGYLAEAENWPLARAVAASSCFPPVFGPMPIRKNAGDFKRGKYHGDNKSNLLSRLELSDGGVYDNMALEPVWKSHQYVLVSDCGAPFEYKSEKNYFSRLIRYTSVISNQTKALRKRLFFSGISNGAYKGAYWGLGNIRKNAEGEPEIGYSKSLVDDIISEVRTDLDCFSDAEIAVLENHGYLIADYVINKRVSELVTNAGSELNIPHPEWMDECRVREALSDSHKRFSVQRMWNCLMQRVKCL